MRRDDLAHIIRAASGVTDDGKILVIGSQAILASYPDTELPPEATVSIEADIAFLEDKDEEELLFGSLTTSLRSSTMA